MQTKKFRTMSLFPLIHLPLISLLLWIVGSSNFSTAASGGGYDLATRSTALSQFLSTNDFTASGETLENLPRSKVRCLQKEESQTTEVEDTDPCRGIKVLYVNCRTGSDNSNSDGKSIKHPLRTLGRALELLSRDIDGQQQDVTDIDGSNKKKKSSSLPVPPIIHLAGGLCYLDTPLEIKHSVQIVGDGATALSGGRIIRGGWELSDLPHHANQSIYVADISNLLRQSTVPTNLEEIKMLRLGNVALRRGRWPKLAGMGLTRGLTTPNFMFTADYTRGIPSDGTGDAKVQYLGVDCAALPPGVAEKLTSSDDNAGMWESLLVHVLGAGERDVNSQLVRVQSVTSTGRYDGTDGVLLELNFRDHLNADQRYHFVNVDWGQLEEGEYYHDIPGKRLYVYPPVDAVGTLLNEGAVAAALDRIVEISRTHSVVISNITFLDTTFFSDGYWDGPAREPSDAAVRINHSANVTIEACAFLESIGGYGVAIGNGTADSDVTGCLFDTMGLGGIALYGYDGEAVYCPQGVEPLPDRMNVTSSGSDGNDYIMTDHVNYEISDEIVVSFSSSNPSADDWIGIYPAGDEDEGTVPHPSLKWTYACGTQDCVEASSSGGAIFNGFHPGIYQAFLIMNDPPPYPVILASEKFAVLGTSSCPVAVNNTKPSRIDIGYNVMSDLGRNLVHVAGVALRAASHCNIHHNRISHVTRYGLQADSFYVGSSADPAGMNTRFNIFEYNIIFDTCRTTTDTGAIEMLGSGDPGTDGGVDGWYTANIIRFNNISRTVGSSSSDGEHVCVHGRPPGFWCRGLVWGIYLDGGQSGVTIYGNIIGATLHGAIFDNVGGNNTHENNILLGEAGMSMVLVDFGEPGTSASHPVERSVSGSIVQRNVFFSRSDSSATAMMAAQAGPFLPELKKNGSDYNLFWSPSIDLSSAQVFPGGADFETWQGRVEEDAGPVTCSNTYGRAARLILSSQCDWQWKYDNATDLKVRAFAKGQKKPDDDYALTLDCNDDLYDCTYESVRMCIDSTVEESWALDEEWEGMDSQGWLIDGDGLIMPISSNQSCLEVCHESGDVRDCNGGEGSVIELRDCTGDANQLFDIAKDGSLRSSLNDGEFCVSPPPRILREGMDANSIIADPLFISPDTGNFDLDPASPAFTLGFKPIPKIEAPQSSCGIDIGTSCLGHFLIKVASVTYERFGYSQSLWLRVGSTIVVAILGIALCMYCRTRKGRYRSLGAEDDGLCVRQVRQRTTFGVSAINVAAITILLPTTNSLQVNRLATGRRRYQLAAAAAKQEFVIGAQEVSRRKFSELNAVAAMSLSLSAASAGADPGPESQLIGNAEQDQEARMATSASAEIVRSLRFPYNIEGSLDLETDFYDKSTGLHSEGVWHNCLVGIASLRLLEQGKSYDDLREGPATIARSLYKYSWDGTSFRRRSWSGNWDHSSLEKNDGERPPPEQPEYYRESGEHRCVQHAMAVVFWSLLSEGLENGRCTPAQLEGDEVAITDQFRDIKTAFLEQFWDQSAGIFRTVSLVQGGGTTKRQSSSSGKRRGCSADGDTPYYRAVDQAIAILSCCHMTRGAKGKERDRLIEIIRLTSQTLLSTNGFGYSDDSATRSYIGLGRNRNFWHDGWVVLSLICARPYLDWPGQSTEEAVGEEDSRKIITALVNRYGHTSGPDNELDGTIWHWSSALKSEEDNVRYCGDNSLFFAIRAGMGWAPDPPGVSRCRSAFWSFIEQLRSGDKVSGRRLASVADMYRQVRLHPNTELAALLVWKADDF